MHLHYKFWDSAIAKQVAIKILHYMWLLDSNPGLAVHTSDRRTAACVSKVVATSYLLAGVVDNFLFLVHI